MIPASAYKTRFTKDVVPNFYIGPYISPERDISCRYQSICYDTDEVKLDIQMEQDKESYRPGEPVTVQITAKDEKGNPVAAHINLA